MVEKLIRWFIFSVIVALLPLIFNALRLITRGSVFSITALTAHGELLLVACAISAAAVGELVASGSILKIAKIIVGGCSIIILSLASLYFADISAARLSGEILQNSVISRVTLILYSIALVSSGCCIALSEVTDEEGSDDV